MSQYFLINCVTVVSLSTPTTTSGPSGTQGLGKKYLAGELIDSTLVPSTTVAGIEAAGGVLLPAADPVLSAAAAIAQARAKNRAVDEAELNGIMMAAAAQSAYQAGVQVMSVDIPESQIITETSGTHFAVGAALPANARVVGAEIQVLTALSGGGETGVAATLQGGTDAAGSMIASTSVFTGAKAVIETPGSDPYQSRGGQQLYMTLTTTTNPLADLTAGHLQVNVFYTVIATTSP